MHFFITCIFLVMPFFLLNFQPLFISLDRKTHHNYSEFSKTQKKNQNSNLSNLNCQLLNIGLFNLILMLTRAFKLSESQKCKFSLMSLNGRVNISIRLDGSIFRSWRFKLLNFEFKFFLAILKVHSLLWWCSRFVW